MYYSSQESVFLKDTVCLPVAGFVKITGRKANDIMKLPWEKKHICWGITGFLTIAACIVFFMILQKWSVIEGILSLIFKSLRPITYGLILAYLMNPLVNVVESGIIYPAVKGIAKRKSARVKGISRMVSITFAWAVTLMVIYAIVVLVLPEIQASIETLVINLPEYTNHAVEWVGNMLKRNPAIGEFLQSTFVGFSENVENLAAQLNAMLPNINKVFTSVTSSLYGLLAVLLNVLVGIIVSVYVLKDKEKFAAQTKRLLYSLFPLDKANGIIALGRMTHDKFGNFITGKIFDSLIIGVICFIVLSICKVPYTVLVSVIVGVTNFIPFFGPFIGAIPSGVLILFADPGKCITFIIIIFLLQQFDGNILGPKILGNTTGISSFWVLFSILVGSGLFGFWGMVCAVPVFAVIYTLVRNGCHSSLSKKGVDYSPEIYEKIDHINEKTKDPVWLDVE